MTVTATAGEVITIGPWVLNEIPPPFVFTFYEDDGVTVVDLSDFDSGDVSFFYRRSRETSEVERTAATLVGDGTTGQVEYAWVVGDFASPGIVAGTYYARFLVSNGTNSYASPLFVYEVKAFL